MPTVQAAPRPGVTVAVDVRPGRQRGVTSGNPSLEGNPVWYKLGDASYVWSSTRDIVNHGEEPR
ncbi:hypothetical protein ACWCPC_34130, partial [Streptomyces decoyicus]